MLLMQNNRLFFQSFLLSLIMSNFKITIMKSIKIISFLLFLVSFVGCFKERVELDLNSGENVRLAVEAWITDLDEVQTITLTTTSDYLGPVDQPPVTDAIVNLSYDNESISLLHKSSGVYAAPLNWRAQPGKEYKLEIIYDGKEYTATSFMDDMPAVENVFANALEVENDTVKYQVLFSFRDALGEGNGYYGVDYRKQEPEWNLTTGGFTNDDFIDGFYLDDVTVTEEFYLLGDTVILEVFSIGMEASDFLFDIQTEVFREGLFDPPPVNIRSNISNGAVGYFLVSGAKRVEVIIE